jgi:hypothetical protein
MSKFNITTYGHKWEDVDWFFESPGSNLIKEKLLKLEQYLTFNRKQSMSKYEVRLYEWVLKKQYKADPIQLCDWVEETRPNGLGFRQKVNVRYYLGYYNPVCKPVVYEEDRYAKEQQKNRARFHSKIR